MLITEVSNILWFYRHNYIFGGIMVITIIAVIISLTNTNVEKGKKRKVVRRFCLYFLFLRWKLVICNIILYCDTEFFVAVLWILFALCIIMVLTFFVLSWWLRVTIGRLSVRFPNFWVWVRFRVSPLCEIDWMVIGYPGRCSWFPYFIRFAFLGIFLLGIYFYWNIINSYKIINFWGVDDVLLISLDMFRLVRGFSHESSFKI